MKMNLINILCPLKRIKVVFDVRTKTFNDSLSYTTLF